MKDWDLSWTIGLLGLVIPAIPLIGFWWRMLELFEIYLHEADEADFHELTDLAIINSRSDYRNSPLSIGVSRTRLAG